MEEFKEIKGYEGLYEVSDLGNVKSLRTNTLLKFTTNKENIILSVYLIKIENKDSLLFID